LPRQAAQLLVQVLEEMGAGKAVTVTGVEAELTTQEAAKVLGVSRPFVIRQMEAGELAYRRVGTHRRVRYTDLMKFKERMDARERKAIEKLMEEAGGRGEG
jgi:excisionase family DNA binding protein